MKVTIIQGQLPDYRIPVFNILANSVQLTVVHSGTRKENCNFKQTILPKTLIGPFVLQKGLYKNIKFADVIIAMFDIRWISIIMSQFRFQFGKKPWIYWGHGVGRSQLLSKLRIVLAKKANAVLLYSLSRSKPFLMHGMASSKIFVAPNTLVISNAGYNEDSDRNDFLFVGSLYKEKLVHELVEAFTKFAAFSAAGILHIVGRGNCKDELIKLVEQNGLSDRVVFHGQILDNEKLKPLFDTSLAYVSPGVVGLGVLHSFAYGVPVVTKEGLNHGPEFSNLTSKNSYVYRGGVNELVEILKTIKDDDFGLKRRVAAYEHYKNKRQPEHMISGFLHAINFVYDKKNN